MLDTTTRTVRHFFCNTYYILTKIFHLAIANGCFFNIGARLARYTDNSTYADWAEKTWDWLWDVGYINHENWYVYDGAHVEEDCKDINKITFSYNAAILAQGVAFMYNYVSKPNNAKATRSNHMPYRPRARKNGLVDSILCSTLYLETFSPTTLHTKSPANLSKVPAPPICCLLKAMSIVGYPSLHKLRRKRRARFYPS